MKKKKCPFHRGQRIRRKGTKSKKYGIVMSNGWYTIGDPYECRSRGGPLIIEGHIAIEWNVKGKMFRCMVEAKLFEAF